jgi:uncharacterized damage-inducible protein DinB
MSQRIRFATVAACLLVASLVSARDVSAQATLSTADAAQLRTQYLTDLDTVHVKTIALATAIPEDKYSWRPAPGVRSVSEVLMHLSGEWYFFCPRSVGADAPADFGVPKDKLAALEKITAKSEVLAQLQKSWAHCAERVAAVDAAGLTGKYKPWGVTLGEAAFGMSGDQHEHLGQLVAYARSIGVKPPWSK